MDVHVQNVPEQRRYEARADGPEGELVGIADYVEQDGVVAFTHTEVPRRFGGQGVGSRLVAAALDDVRAQGLQAQSMCWFVSDYIRDHPEYADLLVRR